eukprot:10822438-Heterocapsa_arctica.AAC.1
MSGCGAAQMQCSAAHCSWSCSAAHMYTLQDIVHRCISTFTRVRFPQSGTRDALDIYAHAVSTYGCGAAQMQCSAAHCSW